MNDRRDRIEAALAALDDLDWRDREFVHQISGFAGPVQAAEITRHLLETEQDEQRSGR